MDAKMKKLNIQYNGCNQSLAICKNNYWFYNTVSCLYCQEDGVTRDM